MKKYTTPLDGGAEYFYVDEKFNFYENFTQVPIVLNSMTTTISTLHAIVLFKSPFIRVWMKGYIVNSHILNLTNDSVTELLGPQLD